VIALTVVIVGALAAVVRWLVSRWLASDGFPWAVLVVNVIGSGLGGAVLGLAQAGALSADIRLVLLTGLCGGITTFSTFGVETVQLVLDRRYGTAALNVGGNLVLGLAAAVIGYLIAV
jgi:CrcB protein